MKRNELKLILVGLGYKEGSIKAILAGIRTPISKNQHKMWLDHGVPLEAWIDIKSFLSTQNIMTKKSTKRNHKEVING